jgi:hypothetical protein
MRARGKKLECKGFRKVRTTKKYYGKENATLMELDRRITIKSSKCIM